MEQGTEEVNKIFPSRHKWSIGVSGATVVSLAICLIGFAVRYGDLSVSDCAIQSVFGIYMFVLICQLIIIILSWVGICYGYKKDLYRLNITGHVAGAVGIMTGCVIFGVKKKEDIIWNFWFAVIAFFLCCLNLAIWFPTQVMRRREKLIALKSATSALQQPAY